MILQLHLLLMGTKAETMNSDVNLDCHLCVQTVTEKHTSDMELMASQGQHNAKANASGRRLNHAYLSL